MELNQEVETEHTSSPVFNRKIGELGGIHEGPTLIFVGGIHGNEPAGANALREIFDKYAEFDHLFRGKAYAFAGNLKALEQRQRFIQEDLNRMWHDEEIDRVEAGDIDFGDHPDKEELVDLFNEFLRIVTEEKGPFMFFDLHTTSSASVPFILINDTMINRRLALKYPMRVILGIEEYLQGPMLSYINDQGYVSLGFEAGQHDDPSSMLISKTFILQTFMLTGFMKDAQLYEDLIRSRRNLPYSHTFFEVRHRYQIREDEIFRMIEGYNNFSKIKQNQLLARNERGEIRSLEAGYLFMPLYQRKGSEGFYIIKLIPKFWLRFSSFLRRINFDYLLLILPGVSRYEKGYKTLQVDVRVARFLSRQIFHLLGYRRVKRSGFKLLFIKRETNKHKY